MRITSRITTVILTAIFLINTIGVRPAAAGGEPHITSISPTQGAPAGGTSVRITGTGFAGVVGANGVTFGAANATSYTVNSATQITAIAPAHAAGSVDIVVRNAFGASPFVPADTYTYAQIVPAITSVSPTQGQPSGGNSVIITGSGFSTVVNADGVTFGATNATSYTVNSDTKITAIAPAHATGSVDVVVTNPAGSSPFVAADNYTYATAAPAITTVSPTTGPPYGGSTVIIAGSGFSGVVGPEGVTFGGVNATSYTVNSNTQITAITPVHAVGTVDVVVTSPVGSSPFVAADTFTYATPAVAVTAVNPTQGSPAGGTTVIITGSGFIGVVGPGGIMFGSVNATSYVVNSNTQITAIAPSHAAGSVDVVATSPAGTSPFVTGDTYTYTIAAPSVTHLNPNQGPIAGGTTVVITGSGFTGVAGPDGVTFGGVDATSYTVDSDAQITAVSPAHPAGTVDVVTTSPTGPSPIVPGDRYTFIAPAAGPGITTSLDPNHGPTAGGTTVVITGSGFTGITGPNGVVFGETNAASYVVNSNTQITAVSPPHVAGSVDVVLTSPTGSSPIGPTDVYTFVDPTPPDAPPPFTAPTSNTDSYIFPSPVHGDTARITYDLSGPGAVTIRIYNEIGDLVDTIKDDKPAGPQISTVNTGRFASGVYIYLLSVEFAVGNTQHYAKRKFVVAH